MKISCQSCHSKYNVADEKVQGKIVKIRCRKCGATIVVNASGGASANGSSAAPPSPTSPEGVGEGVAGEWHVSVADNDQRTMTIAELVAAYNAGTVAQDTFVWTEGMGDWKPLSEVDAIVSALHAAAEQAPPPSPAGAYAYGLSAAPAASPSPAFEAPAPVQSRSPVYEGVLAAPAPDPEPRRAAVVKREARARDLFATRSGEELQTSAPLTHAMAPSAASDDSRLTGQRNENSVLFSLDHLTKNAEPSVQPEYGRSKDDSGIIDLKALTAKAESMRPPTLHDSNALSSPLGMAPPLGFAAPLGAPLGGRGSDTQSKSRFPLYLVGGAALLVVLGIVIGLKNRRRNRGSDPGGKRNGRADGDAARNGRFGAERDCVGSCFGGSEPQCDRRHRPGGPERSGDASSGRRGTKAARLRRRQCLPTGACGEAGRSSRWWERRGRGGSRGGSNPSGRRRRWWACRVACACEERRLRLQRRPDVHDEVLDALAVLGFRQVRGSRNKPDP